jgi:mannose-1-phosphate guanylyltransferase
MIIKPEDNVIPFKHSAVKRPWGYYELYADNEPCTTKILFIKQGETLSLQYHLKRAQFYKLLSDKFIIQYSTTPVPLEIANLPDDDKKFKALETFLENNLVTIEGGFGDMYGFHEYCIHRAKYVGTQEVGLILDVAFGINDERDICRIRDEYSRKGTID